MALASVEWQEKTQPETIARYKQDLRYFLELRVELKRQYAEVVDYSEYEKRIQNLIDRHVGATEVTKITPLVNIFDRDAFAAEVEKMTGSASKAEMIYHRISRTIREKWDEDPAFYKRFSELLAQVIADHRARRISDNDYLARVKEKLEQVLNRSGEGLPQSITGRPAARAFFGSLKQHLGGLDSLGEANLGDLCEDLAHQIEAEVKRHAFIDWTRNTDAINAMTNAVEDCLLEAADANGFRFPADHAALDGILDEVLSAARAHFDRKAGK